MNYEAVGNSGNDQHLDVSLRESYALDYEDNESHSLRVRSSSIYDKDSTSSNQCCTEEQEQKYGEENGHVEGHVKEEDDTICQREGLMDSAKQGNLNYDEDGVEPVCIENGVKWSSSYAQVHTESVNSPYVHADSNMDMKTNAEMQININAKTNVKTDLNTDVKTEHMSPRRKTSIVDTISGWITAKQKETIFNQNLISSDNDTDIGDGDYGGYSGLYRS